MLKAYTHKSVQGKMGSLYGYVMLSNMLEDEERFRTIIDTAIAKGEVEAYPAYTNETEAQQKKRIDRARKEADTEAQEADEEIEEVKKKQAKKAGTAKATKTGSLDSLAALIQGKNKGRGDDFLANLEAKYAGKQSGKGGKKRAKADVEPTDEEFEAIQAKLKRKK